MQHFWDLNVLKETVFGLPLWREEAQNIFFYLLELKSHGVLMHIWYPLLDIDMRKLLSKYLWSSRWHKVCVRVRGPYPQSAVQDGENKPIQDENAIQDVTYVHVWEGLYTNRIHLQKKSFHFITLKSKKKKKKSPPKAQIFDDVERSSPAQVAQLIRTSTASVSRSIAGRSLKPWVGVMDDVLTSQCWAAAGTGSPELSPGLLRAVKPHTTTSTTSTVAPASRKFLYKTLQKGAFVVSRS